MRFEDSKLRQVVQNAAILYPGPSWSYGNGIEALQALPGSEVLLEELTESYLLECLANLTFRLLIRRWCMRQGEEK